MSTEVARVSDPPLLKSFASFNPLTSRTLEECERHYMQVHTRWARNLLRDRPHLVSYHVNRATAAYDVRGGFGQRPDAWRWVILRFQPGSRLGLSAEEQELVAQDHRNCLRDLRSYLVGERIVIDELRSQTSLVKYLFDFDAPPDALAKSAERLQSLADALGELARTGNHGLRLLSVNAVTSEQENDPIDEPGQRPAGRVLALSTKSGFLECYFDQQEWADDLFARPEVRALLRDEPFARVRGYRIDEGCGFDHR